MTRRYLTPATSRTVLAHLAAGASIPQAAAAADLHPSTVRGWLQRGHAERFRLMGLGHEDVDQMDISDSRIMPTDRAYFAFARAAEIAQQTAAGALVGVLHAAATEGVTEITTVETAERNPETGAMVVTSRRTTETTKVDLTSARWLAERLDPERHHLPTRVELTGANGDPIQIAGFSERQADALAIFTRTLIAELVEQVPQRSRQKVESYVPAALDRAMAAIEPPKPEAAP